MASSRTRPLTPLVGKFSKSKVGPKKKKKNSPSPTTVRATQIVATLGIVAALLPLLYEPLPRGGSPVKCEVPPRHHSLPSTNWVIEDRCQFLLANCISVQLDCFLLLVSQGIASLSRAVSKDLRLPMGIYWSCSRLQAIHSVVKLCVRCYKRRNIQEHPIMFPSLFHRIVKLQYMCK